MLSTMGSIPCEGMASASGLELDNFTIGKEDDIEAAYPNEVGLNRTGDGIRIEVERSTM